MSLDFGEYGMDFDSLDVLPTYNLHQRPSKDRLTRLRKLLRARGLDGYLIVDSDAHYTFYAQARQDRRINYITNSEVPIHEISPQCHFRIWETNVEGTMWSCDRGIGQGGIQTVECVFTHGRLGNG
jgi:hypothetical protein